MTQTSFLLRDVTVVDGTGRTPCPGRRCSGGRRIAWLGPADSRADAPPRRRWSRRAAAWSCPGLINSHVHLCNDGAPDLVAQVISDTVPLATLRAAAARGRPCRPA